MTNDYRCRRNALFLQRTDAIPSLHQRSFLASENNTSQRALVRAHFFCGRTLLNHYNSGPCNPWFRSLLD